VATFAFVETEAYAHFKVNGSQNWTYPLPFGSLSYMDVPPSVMRPPGQDRLKAFADKVETAIDGDRFGDCHRAEAAGVKAVDLAVDGGLGDGAGKRLARRGATARIGIIAHSRDPGAGRLGVNGCGLQEEHERRRNERERSLTHGALRPERAARGWRIRSATA
jgi:hypothetical protein